MVSQSKIFANFVNGSSYVLIDVKKHIRIVVVHLMCTSLSLLHNFCYIYSLERFGGDCKNITISQMCNLQLQSTYLQYNY